MSTVATAASSIDAVDLIAAVRGSEPPVVIDVRKQPAFEAAPDLVAGSLRRDPASVENWIESLPAASSFVVYCIHGREVSQSVAKRLRERGLRVCYLAGGIEAWKDMGGARDRKPLGASTRWVTRERPKIDRIACPWLIARFIDPGAQFRYVPATGVLRAAEQEDAIPYDIPDVHFSHDGERCSFDAFLAHYRLRDPALDELALIVRGADTARLELAPQAAGLAAISLGLSRNFTDDHEMLKHGMVMYDALYTWCREGKDELHTWNPQAYR